ncbi:MAG TPA: hypothetical protein VKA31_11475 [Mariprofundaceae bacterium]|nr:hypothetical protein [Mariprofundaceae bacterium]
MSGQLLIGADPELFVKAGDKFRSGYGMIPGTKLEPHKVSHGAVQVDGMALEFNIDPSTGPEDFINNIHIVLSELRKMVPEDYDLALCPTAEFDRQHMAEQPEEARILGCDPDYNAYTGLINTPPTPPATMRTAAGHVHLGWTQDVDVSNPDHFQKCRRLAIQLDYFLGVPSLLLDPDKKRRELYGKAGAFRPKPYGMEYRVLSNFWLRSPQLMNWVWMGAWEGYRHMEGGMNWEMVMRDKKQAETARTIINNGDADEARKLCRLLNINWPARSDAVRAAAPNRGWQR